MNKYILKSSKLLWSKYIMYGVNLLLFLICSVSHHQLFIVPRETSVLLMNDPWYVVDRFIPSVLILPLPSSLHNLTFLPPGPRAIPLVTAALQPQSPQPPPCTESHWVSHWHGSLRAATLPRMDFSLINVGSVSLRT